MRVGRGEKRPRQVRAGCHPEEAELGQVAWYVRSVILQNMTLWSVQAEEPERDRRTSRRKARAAGAPMRGDHELGLALAAC